jgi:metal-responsive CopG/Arc/MetJ family transcriptional regulator
MIKRSKGSSKNTILVEFKAPKELVESFDLRSKANYSSRSEALRALMRSFVEET